MQIFYGACVPHKEEKLMSYMAVSLWDESGALRKVNNT